MGIRKNRSKQSNRRVGNIAILTLTQCSHAIHTMFYGLATLASMTVAAPFAYAADTAQIQTTLKHYDVPAGSLATRLNDLARAAGVLLSFDPALAEGKRTNGISGNYALPDAFARLLAGSNVEAVAISGDRYTLKTLSVVPLQRGAEPNATTLPEVRVSATPGIKESAHGPLIGYVAKRSTTATKTDTPIIEIPQSISIITRDELDDRGVQGMTEALRYVPGVVVDNFGYEPRGFEYILMRGFNGTNSANFRDSLHQLTEGLWYSSFLSEPYGVERIEVMRGPSSIMFGKGDAGGVVNRVSKLPSRDAMREIEVRVGNFNRKQINADVGGAINEDGTLLYRIVGMGLDTNTQVKYASGERPSLERQYLAPSLTWQPSADTSITLLADVLKNTTGASPFYLVAPNGVLTRTMAADPSFVQYKQDQGSIGYKVEHHFNDIWTIRQNFRHAQTSVKVREVNAVDFLEDGQTLLRSTTYTKERVKQTLVDTQLQAKLRTGMAEHTMLFGFDANRADLTLHALIGDTPPTLNVFSPVYNQVIPEPDILAANGKQRVQQLGFYLQDQVKFNQRWILTLGGRQDRVKTVHNDVPQGIAEASTQNAFSGRAGLTYLASDGWAPYISYAESFVPQVASTFDGRLLDPSRGRQYEIGVKYQPQNSNSLYTAAIFDLTKTNVATPDLNPEHLVLNPFASIQTGAIRSRGLELEARTELTRNLNAIGAFTYNDVEVTKSNDIDLGKVPPRVPKTTASLWLDYKPSGPAWQGFGFGSGVRYTDSRFNDPTNTSSLPSFTLFDAGVRYESGHWRYALNAANLFNKEYTSTKNTFTHFLGTQRTVIASVKYRW
ncbi:Iron complex outermembrane recepter protein [Candidatus Nitrotoga sp. HW29]|uniref:TonB-dependent siderophore receptor n=1 Tax=Candidatus Nitrotoga sp. HW29 TaxID=2886963 RepID=UPI001EF35F99|nr:TonB-dependent siderophore receptor [Candidatus Nitrotoga sp. HW29]CAH1903792.1 Iron complex outermembrane recepter protein [Candidatus Nitrotoga sp. HW29]